MKIAIVGAGVLGTSLGMLLQRSGHALVALCSRTKRQAQAAAAHLGSVRGGRRPRRSRPWARTSCCWRCPTGRSRAVAAQVVGGRGAQRGAVVAHLAGGLPASLLDAVHSVGALRGGAAPAPDVRRRGHGRAAAARDVLLRGGRPRGGRGAARAGRRDRRAGGHAVGGARRRSITRARWPRPTSSSRWWTSPWGCSCRRACPAAQALPALLPLLRGTVANLEVVGLPGRADRAHRARRHGHGRAAHGGARAAPGRPGAALPRARAGRTWSWR